MQHFKQCTVQTSLDTALEVRRLPTSRSVTYKYEYTNIWYFVLLKYLLICGPGSSVGIATELRAERSGDRIPVGRDFPPVQTGPGTHPASCTMGTGSFPGGGGVNYGRGVLLTNNPFLVPWSWNSRAIPLPTLWATPSPVMGTLYFCLFLIINL